MVFVFDFGRGFLVLRAQQFRIDGILGLGVQGLGFLGFGPHLVKTLTTLMDLVPVPALKYCYTRFQRLGFGATTP